MGWWDFQLMPDYYTEVIDDLITEEYERATNRHVDKDDTEVMGG